MSEGNLICVICQKNSSLKCARCHRVTYCSKEHQKLDWKIHKKSCELMASKCFKVTENEKLGRHLVSARHIMQGEAVLEESPLITGPMEITPPVCLGCYKLLNHFNSQNCSRCNWPVCSRACENSCAHKPECEITTRFKKEKVNITKFEIDHPSYRCITVLRCLYLNKWNKVAWEKITKLESHSEKRKNSEKYNTDMLMVARFIPRFFNFHEFTEEDILKMTGILEVNAHHLPSEGPGFIAIYDKASLVEHSCVANCSKSFSEDGKIIIRAARAIQKGEHLSISYTLPLWAKPLRQEHLLSTKYFVCKCERCSDPTELGTNFNSYKCATSDCSGYIVPHMTQIPLFYHWQCMDCGRAYSEDEFTDLLGDVKIGISNLNKTDPESCKEFLTKYKKYLHQNHFFMVDAKLALIGCYEGEKVCDASDEDLKYIISICNSLIDLASKLVPAENRIRGVLYFYLYSALAELGRRKSLSGEMDDSQFNQNLLTCRDVLKKAFSFLKTESQALPEGQIAIVAIKYMHEINNFMERTQLF